MTLQPVTRTHDVDPDSDQAESNREFAGFYGRYRVRLLAYLLRVMPRADVEAISQETFCRALAHMAELRDLPDPWPWLAVVARNLGRNQLRDEAMSAPVGLHAFDEISEPGALPDEQACDSDQLRRLSQALAVLSPGQRRMLSLVVVDGVSSAEAGRMLGVREDTARQQVCRLRARLMAEFTALGGRLAVFPVVAWRLARRLTPRMCKSPPPVGLMMAATCTSLVLGTALGSLPGRFEPSGPPLRARLVAQPDRSPRLDAPAPAMDGPRRGTVELPEASSPPPWAPGAAQVGRAEPAIRGQERLYLSRTPTRSTHPVGNDTTVTTPYGTLVLPIDVNRYGPWPASACKASPSLCG